MWLFFWVVFVYFMFGVDFLEVVEDVGWVLVLDFI